MEVKTGKKADWKTDKILATTSYHQQTGWADSIIENKNMLFIQEKIEKLFDMTKKQAKRKSCFS